MRPIPWIPLFACLALLCFPLACTNSGMVTVVSPSSSNTLGGRDWNYSTLGANFPARGGEGSAVFNNMIWVIGGNAGVGSAGPTYNDVWYSPDGAGWTKVLADTALPGLTQFTRRSFFTCAVFKGKLWVIGGLDGGAGTWFNDVWSSPDGILWTQALADTGSPGPNQFSRREGMASAVDGTRIWLMGGNASGAMVNDVWSSTDGVSWTQDLPDTGSPGPNQFSRRGECTGAFFNNQLWVMGGSTGAGSLNDVWSSPDGATWTQALADAASPGPNQFSRRAGHTSVVYGGALWVIGGLNGGYLNDVWYSANGSAWTPITNAAAFSARYNQGSLVFNNEMWVMGGYGTGGALNDVWHSPF